MNAAKTFPDKTHALVLLFFISGFASLCYQIVWQRLLFATFGINIESVTIIVSLFMFGLGLGSLAGVWLQKYPRYLLHLFIIFEVTIGIFGFFSQSLISWLGTFPGLNSLWTITACVYVVFSLPTLLMGATLPLLVGYINRYIGNTGTSTSWLYASNTFGAMAAAFMTVSFLFVHWGLHAVILTAVSLNFLTAASAFLLYRKAINQGHVEEEPASEHYEAHANFLSPAVTLLVGFLLGYIALSQELMWFRILGFITGSLPHIFGWLLGAVLAGIALSSLNVSAISNSSSSPGKFILQSLARMTLAWILVFPIIAFIADNSVGLNAYYGFNAAQIIGIAISLFAAGYISYLSGGIFPLLCHLYEASSRQSAGKAVGKLYFVNVMGATLGPLLTGFVAFEYLSFQTTVFLIAAMTVAVILLITFKSGLLWDYKGKVASGVALVLCAGLALHLFAYDRFFEKVQLNHPSPTRFEAFKANRYGIIDISEGRIYGNGAYDGMMNIDPKMEENGIIRAYSLAVFHPNPKRILEIGLSGGSWAKVFTMYKPLEQLVSVEINKGYFDIIEKYPDHADILTNPKVEFIVDDGRRWLKNNPDEKFDVIAMNTSIHWRSNSTNVLSREFMELCKKHLNPGGYIFINATGAQDVVYTAAQVFPYVSFPLKSMVLAGDAPSTLSYEAKAANLKKFYYPNGQQVFKDPVLLKKAANMSYPNQRDEFLKKNLMVVTDDNMATEFKKGHH